MKCHSDFYAFWCKTFFTKASMDSTFFLIHLIFQSNLDLKISHHIGSRRGSEKCPNSITYYLNGSWKRWWKSQCLAFIFKFSFNSRTTCIVCNERYSDVISGWRQKSGLIYSAAHSYTIWLFTTDPFGICLL